MTAGLPRRIHRCDWMRMLVLPDRRRPIYWFFVYFQAARSACLCSVCNRQGDHKMPARSTSLRRSGKYRFRKPAGSVITRPTNLQELLDCLHPSSQFNAPFRPMGANSASTDCNVSSAGTVIDMTSFNEILDIDAYNDTVTVQAGVRLGTLAKELSKTNPSLRLDADARPSGSPATHLLVFRLFPGGS